MLTLICYIVLITNVIRIRNYIMLHRVLISWNKNYGIKNLQLLRSFKRSLKSNLIIVHNNNKIICTSSYIIKGRKIGALLLSGSCKEITEWT